MHRRQVLALLPSLAVGVSGVARGQSRFNLLRTVTLLTMTEATLLLGTILKAHAKGTFQYIKWWSNYTDRTWEVICEGGPTGKHARVKLSGYVWGEERQDLLVVYSGAGQIGGDDKSKGEPVLVHGRADWLYDRDRKDYLTTDFRHLTKFGENSVWGWVVGSEIVVGGTIGAAATIAAAPVTAGASFALGLFNVSAGAGSFVTISQGLQSLRESNKPVAAPELPPRPTPPAPLDPLPPKENNIVVAISTNPQKGDISGHGPDPSMAISGSFDNAKGTAGGSVERLERK